MSSSSDRYFGTSYSKSRRSSPDHSQGGFFQTGQGGRTVLPPLSSAFPTSHFPGLCLSSVSTTPRSMAVLCTGPVSSFSSPQSYTQPRSSPSRCDYNPAVYNQWIPNNPRESLSPSLSPTVWPVVCSTAESWNTPDRGVWLTTV